MGAIRTFFRSHRWQRRALTILAAVAVGMGAAVLLRPPIREYYLLRDLGSEDPKVREAAVVRGVNLGRLYPHAVTRLNEALSTDDDQKFYAITRVLGALGSFRVSGRDPNQIDRRTLIEFLSTRSPQPKAGATSHQAPTSRQGATSQASSSPSGTGSRPASASESASRPARADVAADTRLLLFQGAVFVGRDNLYTRRLLAAAASDESPAIRQASAVLAARFADANTLLKLLADPDPNVVEWAAIDAGLGSIWDLYDPAQKVLLTTRDPAVVSGCSYLVARLWMRSEPPNSMQNAELASRILEANDPLLRDRLLFVARVCPEVVMLDLAITGAPELPDSVRYLPEMMLLTELGSDAGKVLASAVSDPNSPTRLQVLAALENTDGLYDPEQLEAILRKLWEPQNALILVAAAERLGQTMYCEWFEEYNLPPKEKFAQTLREAALFEPPEDPNDPEFALAVPSAAAAVALWLREPSASFVLNVPPPTGAEANAPEAGTRFDANSTGYLVYLNSCSDHQLPPDYISWHLARSRWAEAFELGMNLLPPPSDPRAPATRRGFRNYSVNSRQTAAMLLALSARTPEQEKAALDRITSRLEGGPLGAPNNFYEVGTYQCALLILGEAKYRQNLEGLLATGAFPARRAITALCAGGGSDANAGRAGLDWLLWDTQASTNELADILVGTGLEEVLRVLVPELPTVDSAAGDALRNWQVRIMQDYYRIHREKIRFAPWQ